MSDPATVGGLKYIFDALHTLTSRSVVEELHLHISPLLTGVQFEDVYEEDIKEVLLIIEFITSYLSYFISKEVISSWSDSRDIIRAHNAFQRTVPMLEKLQNLLGDQQFPGLAQIFGRINNCTVVISECLKILKRPSSQTGRRKRSSKRGLNSEQNIEEGSTSSCGRNSNQKSDVASPFNKYCNDTSMSTDEHNLLIRVHELHHRTMTLPEDVREHAERKVQATCASNLVADVQQLQDPSMTLPVDGREHAQRKVQATSSRNVLVDVQRLQDRSTTLPVDGREHAQRKVQATSSRNVLVDVQQIQDRSMTVPAGGNEHVQGSVQGTCSRNHMDDVQQLQDRSRTVLESRRTPVLETITNIISIMSRVKSLEVPFALSATGSFILVFAIEDILSRIKSVLHLVECERLSDDNRHLIISGIRLLVEIFSKKTEGTLIADFKFDQVLKSIEDTLCCLAQLDFEQSNTRLMEMGDGDLDELRDCIDQELLTSFLTDLHKLNFEMSNMSSNVIFFKLKSVITDHDFLIEENVTSKFSIAALNLIDYILNYIFITNCFRLRWADLTELDVGYTSNFIKHLQQRSNIDNCCSEPRRKLYQRLEVYFMNFHSLVLPVYSSSNVDATSEGILSIEEAAGRSPIISSDVGYPNDREATILSTIRQIFLRVGDSPPDQTLIMLDHLFLENPVEGDANAIMDIHRDLSGLTLNTLQHIMPRILDSVYNSFVELQIAVPITSERLGLLRKCVYRISCSLIRNSNVSNEFHMYVHTPLATYSHLEHIDAYRIEFINTPRVVPVMLRFGTEPDMHGHLSNLWKKLNDAKSEEDLFITDYGCCICLVADVRTIGNFAILDNCTHVFCMPCLTVWFANRNSCAVCRTVILGWTSRDDFLAFKARRTVETNEK